MKDAMTDASKSEVRKTRVKPKIIKEGAMAKGLEALAALESSDIAAKPVQATARTFVREGIETILRLRSKGVPLLRIYNDARKAAGLRIGYQTFAGYVSEISKEKGLRPAKASNEATPAARPQPEPGPASVSVEASFGDAATASPAERAAAIAAQVGGAAWGCSRCEAGSERRTRQDGKAWWVCPGCGAMWADEDGRITSKRLNTRKDNYEDRL